VLWKIFIIPLLKGYWYVENFAQQPLHHHRYSPIELSSFVSGFDKSKNKDCIKVMNIMNEANFILNDSGEIIQKKIGPALPPPPISHAYMNRIG
jgi:hypothetical protein